MICSKCRFDDSSTDASVPGGRSRRLNRYVCTQGHLMCKVCIKRGKDRVRKCPICGGKIVQKLNVFDLDVPRMEITQVNSCSSLHLDRSGDQDVIQIEPLQANFEQLQSVMEMEAPGHYSGLREDSFGMPGYINLSSAESYGEIPCEGLTYFKREPEPGCSWAVQKNVSDPQISRRTVNLEPFNQFPFKVSYDSVEINQDPRERQRLETQCQHEYVIALHSYEEPTESGPNQHQPPPFSQNPANDDVLQYFRIINDSYDEVNEQRAGEAGHGDGPCEPMLNLVTIEPDGITSKGPRAEVTVEAFPPAPPSKSVTALSISRAPIHCPISTCNKLEFKSYVVKHIQTDHPRVLLQIISSGMERSHLWDTRVERRNTRKCHVVYLLKDRIRDLGGTEFQNYLPIMVMTTKFKASTSLFNELHPSASDTKERSHFMIWLTGFAIKEVPVFYTLTLYSDRFGTPGQRIVFCNELYSWRKDQTPRALYETGSALILTHQQFTQLSHGGTEMIRVKILIH